MVRQMSILQQIAVEKAVSIDDKRRLWLSRQREEQSEAAKNWRSTVRWRLMGSDLRRWYRFRILGLGAMAALPRRPR